MSHIVPLGFLNVSLMTANLLLRHKDQIKDGELVLREDGDRPILQTYKSARMALTQIRKIMGRGDEPADLGRCAIEVLEKGDSRPWVIDHGEYAESHIRLHCCLVPSPGAWLYAGGEGIVSPVGQLTAFNHLTLHSEINLGPVDRIHLVVDVRRHDAP